METRLFLGIADTNYCTFVVVGDSSGEILSTGRGGSVNHRYWGVKTARSNLKRIIEAVGQESRSKIAGVCFTYKKGHQLTQEELLPVVAGLVDDTVVQVEDYATSGALGLHSPKERLLLMGSQVGLAVLQSEGGQQHRAQLGELLNAPGRRIDAQLASWARWGTSAELADFLKIQELQENGQCLSELAELLDRLSRQGNPWALAAASDIALDLVRLVTRLGKRFSRPDPVIGLYGPLLLGSEFIRQRVQYLLGLLFPQAEVVRAPLAPAKGAYLASLLTRKSGAEQEVLTTFYNSARSVMQRGWLDFVAESSSSTDRRYCC